MEKSAKLTANANYMQVGVHIQEKEDGDAISQKAFKAELCTKFNVQIVKCAMSAQLIDILICLMEYLNKQPS